MLKEITAKIEFLNLNLFRTKVFHCEMIMIFYHQPNARTIMPVEIKSLRYFNHKFFWSFGLILLRANGRHGFWIHIAPSLGMNICVSANSNSGQITNTSTVTQNDWDKMKVRIQLVFQDNCNLLSLSLVY